MQRLSAFRDFHSSSVSLESINEIHSSLTALSMDSLDVVGNNIEKEKTEEKKEERKTEIYTKNKNKSIFRKLKSKKY